MGSQNVLQNPANFEQNCITGCNHGTFIILSSYTKKKVSPEEETFFDIVAQALMAFVIFSVARRFLLRGTVCSFLRYW